MQGRLIAASCLSVVITFVCCSPPPPPKPSVCDSLERFQASLAAKAAPCNLPDGGSTVSIKTATVAQCRMNEASCTDGDKELLFSAAACAEKYQACDPDAGGAIGWVFGLALGCGSSVSSVSEGCKAAVEGPKDGG